MLYILFERTPNPVLQGLSVQGWKLALLFPRALLSAQSANSQALVSKESPFPW